ncbi:hypothetical protein D910_05587 [Dendroctonus ponderosae]
MKTKNPNPSRSNSSKRQVEFYVRNDQYSCSRKTFREIRHYQQMTDVLIPKISFQRLIMEILRSFNPDARIAHSAVEACQVVAEHYLVELFNDSQRAANHARRKTVQPRDMQLVLEFKPV